MNLEIHIGFLTIHILDIIEIFIVGFLLSEIYKLLWGSVAVKALFGFLFFYFFYVIVKTSGMKLLTLFLGRFMEVGLIAVIILFQQEIRKFLFVIGGTNIFDKSTLLGKLPWFKNSEIQYEIVNSIIESIKIMSSNKTGALIVISKSDDLHFYEDSGDIIDAKVSKRLLISIFNKLSPLHDGGTIIHEGRIAAARCILPISDKDDLPANLGLRHRAGVGISEITNTFVIIVSEENGHLSTAKDGLLNSSLSAQEIKYALISYLYGDIKKEKEEKNI